MFPACFQYILKVASKMNMMRGNYIPKVLCMFASLYVPSVLKVPFDLRLLCSQGCLQGLGLSVFPGPFLLKVLGRIQSFKSHQVPMFPRLYVSIALCSQDPGFVKPYVHRVSCSLGPMFSGSYSHEVRFSRSYHSRNIGPWKRMLGAYFHRVQCLPLQFTLMKPDCVWDK